MKATRQSISISGALYARFQAACMERGVSVSSVVEGLLADLDDGQMPTERTRSAAIARRAVLAPTLHFTPGQGSPRLSNSVSVTWSEAVADLVYDSLPPLTEGAHGEALVRDSWRPRPAEASAALDAAITRMLDTYEAQVAGATHCAICRVRSRNARPFAPLLAGEGVVAVCTACLREGRSLDGGRRVA